MSSFLEFEEDKKTIKSINLDDFSIEDLKKYIIEIENEIIRAKEEIKKKSEFLREAEDFFK